jgi:hypothetical protein
VTCPRTDSWFRDGIKVVGVSHEGRQEVCARIAIGDWLRVVREPDNQYDANACGLWRVDATTGWASEQVGFLPREDSAKIGPMCDEGWECWAKVSAVLGGRDGKSLGLRVKLRRRAAK